MRTATKRKAPQHSRAIPTLARQLDKIVMKLFELGGGTRGFVPVYPWMFVRVLGQEYKTGGGIIIPGSQKNKPIHEGIVLRTWKPFHQTISSVKVDGKPIERKILLESQFQALDHILFPHWEGQPIPWLDEHNYRMVREFDPDPLHKGGVIGTLTYESTLRSQLEQFMDEIGSPTPQEDAIALTNRFLVVPNAIPLTESGSNRRQE